MRAELGPRALMRRAMELAELGRGRTSPNPVVGALLVKDGKVIAEGHHAVLGGAHAERVAFEAAGTSAYGSILYTTLEPCRNFGRTPPCTDAIIGAGVSKVVVGSIDPNPRVDGESIKLLRNEGIEVEVGICADEVARQNETYFNFITTGRPFVLLKAAMTLDGKLSLKKGVPTALTSKTVKKEMHELRASYDSILVGIETILSDNPRLTARLDHDVARQPARIVLDSQGRIPLDAAVVDTAGDILTVVAMTNSANPNLVAALEERGVVALVLPDDGYGRVDLNALLTELGSRSIASLLVEGGSTVHTAFVRQDLADKYVLLYAPYLVGGESPGMIEGDTLRSLEQAEKLRFHASRIVGQDLVVEAYPARVDPDQTPWAIKTREASAGNMDVGPLNETTIETQIPIRGRDR